jgi:hypothetical protein
LVQQLHVFGCQQHDREHEDVGVSAGGTAEKTARRRRRRSQREEKRIGGRRMNKQMQGKVWYRNIHNAHKYKLLLSA